ncbi:hypothetical protein CDAR_243771 [Caerostris darwini]|uniref:Uncharacterized protein n=1 Tax=Caerostris darwini TaxID=1538125 RepID=A0AAV4N5B8_9ARAC|nr:hypothetical protein CDAR_243771 [Caerostris darwini]
MSRQNSEEVATQTVLEWWEHAWEAFEDDHPVTTPMFWTTIVDNVEIALEDQSLMPNTTCDSLKTCLVIKTCVYWTKKISEWEIKSFPQLAERFQRLLAATCRTSLSRQAVKKINECMIGLVNAGPINLESSSPSMKWTTSPSCTIVHTPIAHAHVSSQKKQSLK